MPKRIDGQMMWSYEELDAAILAERERCAAVCRGLKSKSYYGGCNDALDLAEQKIKEGG